MKRMPFAVAAAAMTVALAGCGSTNAIIGTGENSLTLTNGTDATIASLEVLAGAPEGFETVLDTADKQTIDPGQTVEIHYEVGQAVYTAGSEDSGESDQTTELAGDVAPADEENGEQALVDEVAGNVNAPTTDEETDTATVTSTTGVQSRPIEGDAIRVTTDKGDQLLFDGLDLTSYKEVTLREDDNDVCYVDYVTTDGTEGSTKDAAIQAEADWQDQQAASDDATAENGTDPDAAYDEGYTLTDGTETGEPTAELPAEGATSAEGTTSAQS